MLGESLLVFSGWKIWESEEGGCKRDLWGKAGVPFVTAAVYGLCYMLARCTTHGEGIKDKSVLVFSFYFLLKSVTCKATLINVKVGISIFQLNTEFK